MSRRIRNLVAICLGVGVIAAIAIVYMLLQRAEHETYRNLNRNLSADGVELYMPEQRLVEWLGAGEYVEGMGGHGREYAALRLTVSFSGDPDNDFYGRVSQLEFSNPTYSVYGIRPGDPIGRSADLLEEKGYRLSTENIYRNGEYVIQLYGTERIESVRMWFDDKDLRDRSY